MDFFGLSPRSELSTPTGQAIDKATSDYLIGPDWAANMEICDMINSSQERAQDAIKAFKRKLRSDNPKTVQLTLTLLEAAVKNTGDSFHAQVGNRDLLGDIVALTEGRKSWEVREQALGLIQEWGLGFQAKQDRLPHFYSTYMRLRLKGVQFPPIEASSPIFTPPPQHATTPISGGLDNSATAAPETADLDAQLRKLEQDLDVVADRVRLCREMLPLSPGIGQDAALAEVVGFLEACRPRLVGVIEAGMQGAFTSEDVLEQALRVNHELLRTLEAEKSGETLPVDDGLKKAAENSGATDDLLDFGDNQMPTKGSAELDLFGSAADVGRNTSLKVNRGGSNRTAFPAPSASPQVQKGSSANPFDAFSAQGGAAGSTTSGVDELLQGLSLESQGPLPPPPTSSSAAARDPLLDPNVVDDFDNFVRERERAGGPKA